MEWKLSAGDYVPDGTGGLTALSGSGEVLARALYRLTARRGALPFLPALGSRLYQLGRERPSAREALAAQYVAEALQEEPDLTARSVKLTPKGDGTDLAVYLEWRGEGLTLQLPLERPVGPEEAEYEND